MSHLENLDIDDVELAVQQGRPLRPGRLRVHLAFDGIGFTSLILNDPYRSAVRS